MNDELLCNATSSQPMQTDILIVDDVLDNIRLLSLMLESKGYQTRKATNGKMALMAVAAVLPHLILLDIRMPEMNGYEVCRQLKMNPETAQIPVIFLSAADEVTDKVEAFRVGGADYITKPFHVEEVLARVQHQLTILAAQRTIYQLNAQLEARVRERTQQLEVANFQLLDMAFRDSLTQLPNRASLMERLQEALDRQKADPHYQFAVFYLDCDRFKNVNDSLGHQVGDELLVVISQRLKSILRQNDLLFRLGGDEFVILFNQLAGAQTVIHIAERLLNSFAVPFHFKEREIFVSFSIGIVLDAVNYQKPEELLRDADTAMYQAKALGKDQYQIFTPAMYQKVYHRLQLETDLRKALQRNEFILYYQPIVDLGTETMIGVEALIRWQHPTLGLVPPDQFIPIAEETGLIFKLGRWALEEACNQLHDWQQKHLVDASFSMSVNVSPAQFAQANYIHQIDEILAKTQINPQCLKLEITETVIIKNLAFAAEIIHKLQKRSIQLSIDDFGTGYSSLNYLHTFPVNTLKIDRSFIQRLQDQKSSLGLVTAIMQIAQTMGMNLVAEGIETREQLTQLKMLHCPLGQGYLFSKPLPAPELMPLLSCSSSLSA